MNEEALDSAEKKIMETCANNNVQCAPVKGPSYDQKIVAGVSGRV